MGKQEKPMMVCTRCRAYSVNPHFFNQRCDQVVNGKRCREIYRSALRPDDWKECTFCEGVGFVGKERCPSCNGSGWSFIRGINR